MCNFLCQQKHHVDRLYNNKFQVQILFFIVGRNVQDPTEKHFGDVGNLDKYKYNNNNKMWPLLESFRFGYECDYEIRCLQILHRYSPVYTLKFWHADPFFWARHS